MEAENQTITKADVGTLDLAPKPKKSVFCAHEQTDTDHEISVQQNREIVFTCMTCGRFLKFAPGSTKEQMDTYFAAHKEGNKGHVSAEKENKELKDLLDSVAAQMGE